MIKTKSTLFVLSGIAALSFAFINAANHQPNPTNNNNNNSDSSSVGLGDLVNHFTGWNIQQNITNAYNMVTQAASTAHQLAQASRDVLNNTRVSNSDNDGVNVKYNGVFGNVSANISSRAPQPQANDQNPPVVPAQSHSTPSPAALALQTLTAEQRLWLVQVARYLQQHNNAANEQNDDQAE